MALLSSIFRSQAIYGSTDTFGARIAGRQGGEWARRTVEAASHRPAPAPRPPVPEADLADLRRRGIIDDAELATLRARYGPAVDAGS